MEASNPTLDTFISRVRQLLTQYKETVEENNKLHIELKAKNEIIESLSIQVAQIQKDYDSLKMAKMLQISDGDVENAKARVTKLIRDINRCITLINER